MPLEGARVACMGVDEQAAGNDPNEMPRGVEGCATAHSAHGAGVYSNRRIWKDAAVAPLWILVRHRANAADQRQTQNRTALKGYLGGFEADNTDGSPMHGMRAAIRAKLKFMGELELYLKNFVTKKLVVK